MRRLFVLSLVVLLSGLAPLSAQQWDAPTGPFIEPPFEFFGPGLFPRYTIREAGGNVVPNFMTLFWVFEDFLHVRAYGGDAPPSGVLAAHWEYERISANWRGRLWPCLYWKEDFYAVNDIPPGNYNDHYMFFLTPTSGVFQIQAFESGVPPAWVAGTFTIEGSLPQKPNFEMHYDGMVDFIANSVSDETHVSGGDLKLILNGTTLDQQPIGFRLPTNLKQLRSELRTPGLRTTPNKGSLILTSKFEFDIPQALRWSPKIYTIEYNPRIRLLYSELWGENLPASPYAFVLPNIHQLPLFVAADGSKYVRQGTANGFVTVALYDGSGETVRTFAVPESAITLDNPGNFIPGANGKVYLLKGGRSMVSAITEFDPATGVTKTITPHTQLNQNGYLLSYREETESVYILAVPGSRSNGTSSTVYHIPLDQLAHLQGKEDWAQWKFIEFEHGDRDYMSSNAFFLDGNRGLVVELSPNFYLVSLDGSVSTINYNQWRQDVTAPSNAPGWNDLVLWNGWIRDSQNRRLAPLNLFENFAQFDPFRGFNSGYSARILEASDDSVMRIVAEPHRVAFAQAVQSGIFLPASAAELQQEIVRAITLASAVFPQSGGEVVLQRWHSDYISAERGIAEFMRGNHSIYSTTVTGSMVPSGLKAATVTANNLPGSVRIQLTLNLPAYSGYVWETLLERPQSGAALVNDDLDNALPVQGRRFDVSLFGSSPVLSNHERSLNINRAVAWYRFTPSESGLYWIRRGNPYIYRKTGSGALSPVFTPNEGNPRYLQIEAGEELFIATSGINQIQLAASAEFTFIPGLGTASEFLGDGWYEHPLCGLLYAPGGPWVYSDRLGWLILVPGNQFYGYSGSTNWHHQSFSESAYYYSMQSQQWIFVHSKILPHSYNVGTRAWFSW